MTQSPGAPWIGLQSRGMDLTVRNWTPSNLLWGSSLEAAQWAALPIYSLHLRKVNWRKLRHCKIKQVCICAYQAPVTVSLFLLQWRTWDFKLFKLYPTFALGSLIKRIKSESAKKDQAYNSLWALNDLCLGCFWVRCYHNKYFVPLHLFKERLF